MNQPRRAEKRHGASPEDVRNEYTLLNHYGTSLVQIRFTVLGLYLAATGFIVGGTANVPAGRALLLIGVSLGLWILELRNRSLLHNLSGRAIQIERDEWKYRGPAAYDPLVCRQHKTPPTADDAAGDPPPRDTVALPFLGRSVAWPRHGLGFDVIYSAVVVFTVYEVFA